jgi:hypothetical protein
VNNLAHGINFKLRIGNWKWKVAILVNLMLWFFHFVGFILLQFVCSESGSLGCC